MSQYVIGTIEENNPSNLYKIMAQRKLVESKKISLEEVRKKKYVVIDSYVYDLKDAMKLHP